MKTGADRAAAAAPEVADCVRRLLREASLELGSHELEELALARDHLRPGQRIYVSHLPRQTFARTIELCAAVAAAGFEPIPHIPVRLLSGAGELSRVLSAARDVGVAEPLLLAGDHPRPAAGYGEVLQVLHDGILEALGFRRVSFAGHPEGHPSVPARTIHQAQVEKARVATQRGLEVTFVTQFFFEARPFTQWASALRSEGVRARLVAGLAGPTRLTRLLKLATRCGIGPSIRALRRRPSSIVGLLADHDPLALAADLAAEAQRCAGLFDGIHVFSFGGFRRTAQWLRDQTR